MGDSQATPRPLQDHIVGHHALRGLAAISVAVMHLRLLSRMGLPDFGGAVTFWANEAVDLFFILSGFVFAYVYASDKPMNWPSFFVARFARIYPVYLLTLSVVIGLDFFTYLRHGVAYRTLLPTRILSNVFCVQSWVGHATSESINLPSWSVSVEVFLYLFALPVLFMSFGRRPIFGGRVTLTTLCVCGFVAAWCYTSGELHTAPRPLLRGIAGFSGGFILCGFLRGRNWNCPFSISSFLIGCCIVIATVHPQFRTGSLASKAGMWLGLALITYGTFDNSSLPGRIFSNRIFEFLGTISYSLYLWHIPTETFLRRLLTAITHNPDVEETTWFGWLLAVCVIVISAWSYYFFENPLRRMIRHWFHPKRSSTPVAEVTGSVAAETSNA